MCNSKLTQNLRRIWSVGASAQMVQHESMVRFEKLLCG